MPEVLIKNRDQRVEVNPAHSLLNNFLIQQVPIATICGGKARCGRCRIKVLAGSEGMTPLREPEKKRLTPEELAQGWRLACQNHALRDLIVEIPDPV